jgi:pullulanase
MVQALHNAGIGVIMDVVYNHTYDANSNLNKIVPYYYYRYTSTGANSSESGCGNDTASERYMYGKYMVDSTSYWMEEYHLDGFRFDLMGLHDLETMQEIESAVHTINPHAVIYGEGWTMGATIDGSAQANQSNISKIVPTGDAIGGIAVFNDATRDGLKGSVFEEASNGFISGSAHANWNNVLFGINGGNGTGVSWFVKDSMVINYMSAHDNNTLWDKLHLSNGSDTEDNLNRMNNLGAAIIMLSKGTPFWQAGEEMLRSKPNGDGTYNHNSYNSSDEVNNIDWSVLDGESREYKTMLYYKGLIQLRKEFGIFSSNDTKIEAKMLGSGVVILTYDDGNGGIAKVVINPHKQTLPVNLEGAWNLVANSEQAGTSVISVDTGEIKAESISIRVYVNDVLLNNR